MKHPTPSRRRVLRLGGAGAALGLAGGLAGCTETVATGETYRESADWPMAGHDAANTGFQPAASGPTEQPDIAWERDVRPNLPDDPSPEWSRGTTPPTPVVVDGTVYVGGEGLFALDAADGGVRWREFEDEMTFGPAVADGTVYVGSTDADETGRVRALATDDGAVDWETRLGRNRRLLHFGPLVATGERLYVPVSEGGAYAGPADHGRLLAFDRDSNERSWQRTVGTQYDRAAPPGVADGTVYAGGPADDRVQAVGPDCDLRCQFLGEPPSRQWTTDAPVLRPQAAPVVTGSLVYVGEWVDDWIHDPGPPSSYRGLSAFSRDDGSRQWRRELGEHVTSPAVVDGTCYAVGTRSTASRGISTEVVVEALDETGDPQWDRALSDRQAWADPVAAGDVVYVATFESEVPDVSPAVRALDADDGSTLWEREVPTRVTSLALAAGRLYASGWDGLVVALE